MPASQRRPVPNKRYRNTSEYYAEGTAVRAVRPQPQVQPRRRVRTNVRPMSRYAEAEKTASVSLTFPITMLLVVAVAATLFVGYRYLCLKSSLNTHMETVKSLESTLDTARMENDALEKSIDTSIDLNHVYSVAITRLGMVHVGQDNIIQYSKTESEYVKQYEDIPSAQ